MPLTQISLRKGKSLEYRRELMEQIYLAMRDSIGIPENDRFATISELEDGNFNNSGGYLEISRSNDIVFIQITLNSGRTTEQKQAIYKTIAQRLNTSLDIRPEDICISLLEVAKEDWSLGNGIAQYA